MKIEPRPRKGRPRAFDRERALEAAMQLFWSHGFEGASLERLTAEMGITPPSLYAAFGSKNELYREALARYAAEPRGFDLALLHDADDLAKGVHGLLRGIVVAVTDQGAGRGCMVSLGMLASHPDRGELAAELTALRNAMRESLETALRKHVTLARARTLARYLLTLVQGIAVQAHDGATRAELLAVVDEAVVPFQTPPTVRPARNARSR